MGRRRRGKGEGLYELSADLCEEVGHLRDKGTLNAIEALLLELLQCCRCHARKSEGRRGMKLLLLEQEGKEEEGEGLNFTGCLCRFELKCQCPRQTHRGSSFVKSFFL